MDNPIVKRVLALLGVRPDVLRSIREAESSEEATILLQSLKRTAKDRFRALSKKLHPDVHQEPAKTELFLTMKWIAEAVQALEVSVVVEGRVDVELPGGINVQAVLVQEDGRLVVKIV